MSLRRLALAGARRASAGFSLVELAVATTIFAALGYGLASALRVSLGSRDAVESAAADNRELRSAASTLTSELRRTNDALVTVNALADGNHSVTFQLPIVDAGVLVWGVPASSFDSSAAADQPGWSVRYTVQSSGAQVSQDRKLVRQILDAAGEVHSARVLAEDLRSGGDYPGFEMLQTGDVWQITISRAGSLGNQVVLHVATRN